jgi:predicted nucleic-acid-binding protein
MIGIDTNVLVRYIMQDDSKQSPKATKLMEVLTVDATGSVSQKFHHRARVRARWQL